MLESSVAAALEDVGRKRHVGDAFFRGDLGTTRQSVSLRENASIIA